METILTLAESVQAGNEADVRLRINAVALTTILGLDEIHLNVEKEQTLELKTEELVKDWTMTYLQEEHKEFGVRFNVSNQARPNRVEFKPPGCT